MENISAAKGDASTAETLSLQTLDTLRGVPATRLKPLLRWAGGKRNLVHRLVTYVPKDYAERRYFEPFVGAGSLFFALRPPKATLGDLNPRLIGAMVAVRDEAAEVARHLDTHRGLNSEAYYYEQRKLLNGDASGAQQAARFIYINRVCFNGIYRVNMKGEFNVPYGHKESRFVPTASEVEGVSKALSAVDLVHGQYCETLKSAGEGDLVYLDPPYPPLTDTAYFTHYTADRFDASLQAKVAETFHDLGRRGCLVILSNADTDHVRGLYAGMNLYSQPLSRNVSCKKTKLVAKELIVTNFRVEG